MNACLPRPAFDEHRAYINDSRCAMQCSTVYVARADGSDPDLPEPRKPSDAASVSSQLQDYGPIDNVCNLSVTNPATIAHFRPTIHAWDVPKWIKFDNGKRECSTHFADFGPIIDKVAVVDSAPDTLMSVAVLCLKGREVSFKIP